MEPDDITNANQPRSIKLGITGTRYYTNYKQFCQYLDTIYPPDGPVKITTIVSGGAKGADTLAERFAADRGITMIRHPAEWHRYRSKYHAARLRNEKIVADSDEMVAFWNGSSTGTKMTIDLAQDAGKPIRIFRYDQADVTP